MLAMILQGGNLGRADYHTMESGKEPTPANTNELRRSDSNALCKNFSFNNLF